jgi:hypothetical protein
MRYRKPRTFNWVSFLLLALVGLAVYLLVCLWPVYSAHARVRGILLDHVPALYKANLRDDRSAVEEIRSSIANEVKKAGLNDKAMKILLRRNPKTIELEARFKARAEFPWPERTFEFELAPKVVSDATRVDW